MSQLSTNLDSNEATKTVVKDHTEESGTENNESSKEEQSLAQDQSAQLLVQMVSDPQIQEILAARREGREIQVVAQQQQQTEEAKQVEDTQETFEKQMDLSDFDPDVKKAIELLDQRISAKFGPLVDKVGALESVAAAYEQRAVGDQITAISKKHPDFDKYRKDMALLARNEGAGLGVEELLLLVKHRAGDLALTDPSTESERPTPTPRRVTGERQSNRDDQPKNRRKRFQMQLADALDNVDFRPRN